MGKGKLAALQCLFEPPHLPPTFPPLLSTLFNVVMVRWGRSVGGRAPFSCTPFEVLCVHC